MYVPWRQELRTKEKEEKARRRRGGGGGKKTRKWKLRRVMTLAVRPKTLSYYDVFVCGGHALGMRRETVEKTAWVCAGGYAPSPGSKGPPGA